MSQPFQWPKIFQRLLNQQNTKAKHLIKLRENKQYRLDQRSVVVQGLKTIRELVQEGLPLTALAVTAAKTVTDPATIKSPASDVLEAPQKLPAKAYYLTDVNLTRRILGTASRPSPHEIFAEVPIPDHELPPKQEIDRLLVLHRINDPGNVGTLVRTSMGLGWTCGVLTTGTCDLYNDKTIRASRALSLRWKYRFTETEEMLKYLDELKLTPIVADMLPHLTQASDLWSPVTGAASETNPATLGSGAWLWNFQGKKPEMPKRPALILCSEHSGARGLNDQIKISIPMAKKVESLNVASAGSMLMYELNRLMR
ncbi:Alpha/beta knot methyltransferase [Radiomyces spectabilis]|uniref:Alpha/beta knot methyltransferase n=1 Tax=Radiomyces spectabilis TaxID=64574 RepID=UPI00221EA03E|nr:Alpha/beta knot methyltransferase [Radiomyces spectabilis]KAI8391719.1 Alpha/beta knot methyltransferase [Radiomyces spectabilis]